LVHSSIWRFRLRLNDEGGAGRFERFLEILAMGWGMFTEER
jgi:hypothetical protein